MEKYFDKPTQVRFWDAENQDYLGGIAYQDFVICGCCGSTIPLENIYSDNDTPNPSIIVYPWVNISDEIIGN